MAKKKFRMLSKKEDAAINAAIARDPDTYVATKADFKRARPFKEAFPDLYNSWKRGRGRPKLETPREHLSLRLEHGLAAHIKALGRGYNRKVEKVLLDAVSAGKL